MVVMLMIHLYLNLYLPEVCGEQIILDFYGAHIIFLH